MGLIDTAVASHDLSTYLGSSIVDNIMDDMQIGDMMRRMMNTSAECMSMETMMRSMGGMGMMGAVMGGPYEPTLTPITIDRALDIAKQYVASLENPDLEVIAVEEWANNFYFQVREKYAGIFTCQMLIDRYTGSVFPEPGPSIMWTSRTQMTIDIERAKQYAEQFLGGYLPGSKVHAVAVFYGYYHFYVVKDGKIVGMLDVNGFAGKVWFHTWHGPFIQERKA